MTLTPSSRANRWLAHGIALLLGAVTLLVYWPVRHFEFVNWDDTTYIAKNDQVRGGLSWSGFLWSWTHSYSSNWHPLTWLSHMLDCQVYGMNPGGHHLTNLLFHVVNSVLLFYLLRSLTSATWRSACVAALFALHPLHVESVAWIAERKDVLSTLFGLLSLLAYVRYAAKSLVSPQWSIIRYSVMRGARYRQRTAPPITDHRSPITDH